MLLDIVIVYKIGVNLRIFGKWYIMKYEKFIKIILIIF